MTATAPLDLEQAATTNGVAPPRRALTASDVIDAWLAEGPLVRMAMGFPTLDKATRGGLPFGRMSIVQAPPNAGKSAIGAEFCDRALDAGHITGAHIVDEAADEFLVRFAQKAGFRRDECEERDPAVLEEIRDKLEPRGLRFYGEEWTVEQVFADLAEHANGRRIVYLGDGAQTLRSQASALAEYERRPLSTREHVTSVVRAVKMEARERRALALLISEMGRGGYRSRSATDRVDDMAAGAESRAIEYLTRGVLLTIRTAPDEEHCIDASITKNKVGRSGVDFRLAFDPVKHSLVEVDAAATETGTSEERAERARLETKARAVLQIVARHPGIGSTALRTKVKAAGLRLGVETLDVVLAILIETARMENRPEARGDRLDAHYFAIAKVARDAREVA